MLWDWKDVIFVMNYVENSSIFFFFIYVFVRLFLGIV